MIRRRRKSYHYKRRWQDPINSGYGLADEYKDYFMKTFPGALQEVKKISEQ